MSFFRESVFKRHFFGGEVEIRPHSKVLGAYSWLSDPVSLMATFREQYEVWGIKLVTAACISIAFPIVQSLALKDHFKDFKKWLKALEHHCLK